MVGLFPTIRGKPVGMSEPDESDPIDALCSELADLIEERPTVAVAESLTGGGIASALSRASTSGDWFAGGIVAYQPHVKHGLLEVPPGPIVSAQAAETMRLSARGYTRILRVARTIADMTGSNAVGRIHVAEALSYRRRAPTN